MKSSNTLQLLISGGDERLALNANGMNKYGCSPIPDDEILAFSSSTASPLSNINFMIADHLRNRLEQQNFSLKIHLQEVTRQKVEWRQWLNLDSDTAIIFSPSGTDLHRVVSNQMRDHTLIIMVEDNETGSGVARALGQGRGIQVISISLRLADGCPRSSSEIDNEISLLVQKGIAEDRDVLLIIVDQSKTGMIAPSVLCASRLKNQFKTSLHVLVDACQFRVSKETIKSYLQQEFMIALTGSKFLAAPSFAGILLLPPSFISFVTNLEENNAGLLLRMEIALQSYRIFCTLSDAQIQQVIRNFSAVVQHYLNHSPYLELLDVPILQREHLTWDSLPTIFPFLLQRDKKNLSRAETFAIYERLPLQNPRCQVGQPVVCGTEKSALRLCLSAPMIVHAAQSINNQQQTIENALIVLKTIENLSKK